jgi:hypothetical protein
VSLGEKRNHSCAVASGDICLNWDDDDYQCRKRIELSVIPFLDYRINIVGSSALWIYDTEMKQFFQQSDISPYHCEIGQMAFRRSFWDGHRFPHTNYGEDFGDKEPVYRVDPIELIIALNHGGNTVNKRSLVGRSMCFHIIDRHEAYHRILKHIPKEDQKQFPLK